MADNKIPKVDRPDAAHSVGLSQNTKSVTMNPGQPKPPVMSEEEYNSADYPKRAKQGRAVIINNKLFSQKGEREGTDSDKEAMVKLLRKLGFEGIQWKDERGKVQKERMVFQDVNVGQLKNIVINAADESLNDYTAYGCFLCVILSYAEPGVIYCRNQTSRKDEPCEMKNLQEPFKDCASLRLKPKIFLVQGCPYYDVDKAEDPHFAGGLKTDVKKIPRESDFLIHFSSQPGKRRWKFKERSEYIECLEKAIENFCINNKEDPEKSMDFLKVLTRVNSYMCDKKADIPLVTSLLTKKVYFYKNKHEIIN